MRRVLTLAAVVVAGLLGRPSTAAPDAPPPEVTLDEAVALYRQHSVQLAASRARIGVTAADLVDARIYPNPSVGVSTSATVHGTATSGDSLESAELDIPLLVGKRSHREEAARRRIAATRADVTADEAEGAREVRRRFVALLAEQERVGALSAAADEARRVRQLVAGRMQAGAKSPYDLERTDLAQAQIDSRLAEARDDELVAAAALAEAVGIAGWQPHASGAFRPATTPLPTAVADSHPLLARPRAVAEQARAEESLAHAEARPTPNLILSGYGTNGPAGIGLTIGVNLPLPLFDRNQGAVARARATEQEADLDRQAAAFALEATLDRATRELAARRKSLDAFEADAVARLPKIRTMAEDAYQSGQGGIVELLDALDAIIETRLRDIDLVEAVLLAELDLRAAASG